MPQSDFLIDLGTAMLMVGKPNFRPFFLPALTLPVITRKCILYYLCVTTPKLTIKTSKTTARIVTKTVPKKAIIKGSEKVLREIIIAARKSKTSSSGIIEITTTNPAYKIFFFLNFWPRIWPKRYQIMAQVAANRKITIKGKKAIIIPCQTNKEASTVTAVSAKNKAK